jgi:hypothetical protein
MPKAMKKRKASDVEIKDEKPKKVTNKQVCLVHYFITSYGPY